VVSFFEFVTRRLRVSEFLPITKIPRSGLPEYALVCGDPRRAARVAAMLTNSREIGSNREYVTYRGSWMGIDLVVSSHGVGGPGAICMFQELAMAGVKTMIRVGTCGGLAAEIEDGDLIIATAAVREDGVTDQMVPMAYPSFSSPEVVLALQQSAQEVGQPWHRGVIWTQALFFPGVIPPFDGYLRASVIAIEMELSALLVMAAMKGLRAGGILTADGNPMKRPGEEYNPHRSVVEDGIGKSIDVALGAIKQLAEAGVSAPQDRHKRPFVFH
jgi:uridine phosphorylase